MQLSVAGQTVYTLEVDNSGLWIKPDDFNNQTTKVVTLKICSNKLQELLETYRHISFNTLKTLPEGRELDIRINDWDTAECKACLAGKSTQPAGHPSLYQGPRTNRILERIHCDLIGPMKEWLGKKYALTSIDDFSRYCVVIPICKKSNSTEYLKQPIKELQIIAGDRYNRISTI